MERNGERLTRSLWILSCCFSLSENGKCDEQNAVIFRRVCLHAWQKGHANAEKRIDGYIQLITVCAHGLDVQYTTAG